MNIISTVTDVIQKEKKIKVPYQMLLVSSTTSDVSCGIGAPRQHPHRCQPKGDNGVTEV